MYLIKIIKIRHYFNKILLKEGFSRSKARDISKMAHIEDIKTPKYIQILSNAKHKLQVYLGKLAYNPNRKTIQAHNWYLHHFCNPSDIGNHKYILNESKNK